MFDRTLLPPAQYEFVVIADTHYMLDPGGQTVEFASRLQQTARTEYALAQVAALNLPLVIHMGDIVQEFPERTNFAQAIAEATAQLARHDVQPRPVAGNHDVGDKPDPTMPASWVTPAFLADYHARCGRSWTSWDEGDLHFVILNSQIMNSALPEAQEQQRWLEADLAQTTSARSFIFLHLPPFLRSADEPDLGHYDNIGEPARSWLLNLVRRHRVELLLAAHVHWSFYNRVGQTDYFTVPSVAFTRPGFSELFSSPPPSEQGRNDVGKLGFFLIRVLAEGTRVHMIRTGGQTELSAPEDGAQLLVTRTSPDLPASPLGITLHHTLANTVQAPAAWPSTIRQPVRNDYPLLSLLELGARAVRVPASDLLQPVQRERLALLRSYGVAVTASWLWRAEFDLTSAVAELSDRIDGVEVQVLGTPWPDAECLQQIKACRAHHNLPLTLNTMLPGRSVRGKQHARFQRGYHIEQLGQLDQQLGQSGVQVDRVLVWIDPDPGPWQTLLDATRLLRLNHFGAVDWSFGLSGQDDVAQSKQAAEALFAAALHPHSRLYLEPLLDFDRTMDVSNGLLDRTCNPRPAFHTVRTLNSLLFSERRQFSVLPHVATAAHDKTLVLTDGGDKFRLALPVASNAAASLEIELVGAGEKGARRYGLATGTSQPRPWEATT